MNLTRSNSVQGNVDLMLHLSEQAKRTRKPGQTVYARLQELRREVGE